MIEIGIIFSHIGLIIATIALTIVTALNDNAMVKIVRILHTRRTPTKRSKRAADSSTMDEGGNGGTTDRDGASS